MSKIHLKKKLGINISNKNKILLIVVLIIVSILLVFKFISKNVFPTLMNYAESEIKKIAGIVINNSIVTETDNIKVEDLFIIINDEDGKIKSMDFNPVMVNKVLSSITLSIQNNLKDLEKGNIENLNLTNNLSEDYNLEKLKKGIIYEIPTGIVFNNSLLANMGPRIPVRINLIGNILSNVKTDLTDYGINSALVEVYIHIEVELEVLLPFSSGKTIVVSNVPISLKLIQGDVPNYYVIGDKNSSSLTVPVE